MYHHKNIVTKLIGRLLGNVKHDDVTQCNDMRVYRHQNRSGQSAEQNARKMYY